jgi:uncharacterized integral membrane protein (TIGR00698 family)
VHDVGQVVATASGADDQALHTAVLVKLTRVLLLAPLVLFVSSSVRRRATATNDGDTVASRPRLVPTFLIGFIGAILLRSTGLVPLVARDAIAHVQQVLLAAGLFALGTGVRVDKLRRVGAKPFVLGIGSWAVIGAVSWVGVRVLG